MARVTVEDSMKHLENRFELVLVAAKRARQLARGAEATVTVAKDKPTVIALRELADETIDITTIMGDENTPPYFV